MSRGRGSDREVSQMEVGTGIRGTTATIRKQLETQTVHEKKANKMAASLLSSEFHSPPTHVVWKALIGWRELIGWPVFVPEGRERWVREVQG